MDCFLIDGGTTNTRVWLRRGESLRGPERLAVGVRDTAVEGSNRRLKQELAAAFARLSGSAAMPRLAVAAGMITSPLGLMAVPHCPAPAGAAELAAGAAETEFAEFHGLRWLLLPGVRSGPRDYDGDSVVEVDIIRGEETELMGAMAQKRVRPPLVYIHVGSHTKAIRVDSEERITGGVSTLGGELLDAVRRHTILASAVEGAQAGEVALDLLASGAEHARRFGLTRALFTVRLLEQGKRYTPAQLNGFLLGAFIETDLAAIVPQESDLAGANIAVSAPDAALPAWKALLALRGLGAVTLGTTDREACFLAGIQHILSYRESHRE